MTPEMTPASVANATPRPVTRGTTKGFTLTNEPRWSATQLGRLLAEARLPIPEWAAKTHVSSVTSDVDGVMPGALYVIPRVPRARAADLMVEARQRGAVAVMTDRDLRGGEAPIILVDDLRFALSSVASRFHGAPSRSLDVCGIAGSSGKTTIAYLLRAIVEAAGRSAGLVSTLGHETGSGVYRAFNTTPTADRIQALLREMVDAGHRSAIVELSSAGLSEGRADGVWFKTGLCTNLTRDFGGSGETLEEALEAQSELMRALPRDGVAVLNADDSAREVLAMETAADVMTYGVENGGEVHGRVLRLDMTGSEIELRTPFGRRRVRTGLIGHHHVSNVVGAAAAALAMGIDLDAIVRGVAAVTRVPGRMEAISVPAPFNVYLDASSTRSRLAQMLGDVRPLVAGRIWLVLGGDAGVPADERATLAAVAEQWADTVVVTTDRSGTENPMTVIKELVHGLRTPRNARIEPDRRRAIAIALEEAGPGDAVIVVRSKQGAGEELTADRDVIDAWFAE